MIKEVDLGSSASRRESSSLSFRTRGILSCVSLKNFGEYISMQIYDAYKQSRFSNESALFFMLFDAIIFTQIKSKK